MAVPFDHMPPPARLLAPLSCRARPPPRTFAVAVRFFRARAEYQRARNAREDVRWRHKRLRLMDGSTGFEASISKCLGFVLTLAQAARFWSLDHGTCAQVLDALVEARFLIVTSGGGYALAGSSRGEESVRAEGVVTKPTVERGARPLTKRRT